MENRGLEIGFSDCRIAVIGLGYVGLPLAIEFSKKYPVTGFDIDERRIEDLKNNIDSTLEVSSEDIRRGHEEAAKTNHITGIIFSNNPCDIRTANVYIITVPTPIDKYNSPNLKPLFQATTTVATLLKKNDVVIYESTVYPGCTEEECIPLLERESHLKVNKDFFCGYSPERINPGDKEHTFRNIKKITSGSLPEVADFVDGLYNTILERGTYKAPSIMVAEAAKVVENSQRDLNISFANEIALICDRLGIDTNDVLDAAASKWNFVPYRPGLVGGHCIAVDPYYLVSKSLKLGYEPKVIQSGRWVNNFMAKFIADKTVKMLINRDIKIKQASILILGITFKENCPDCRNTKVPDIVKELKDFGIAVDVYDPLASCDFVMKEYGISLLPSVDAAKKYNAIILCVRHTAFDQFDIEQYKKNGAIIFDVKSFLRRDLVDCRL